MLTWCLALAGLALVVGLVWPWPLPRCPRCGERLRGHRVPFSDGTPGPYDSFACLPCRTVWDYRGPTVRVYPLTGAPEAEGTGDAR